MAAAKKPSDATADPPADATPAVEAPSAEGASPSPAPSQEGGVFEYIADTPRTYLPRGLPPQTVETGDVCQLSWTPTDGCWVPSTAPVTRQPDPVDYPVQPHQPDMAQVSTTVPTDPPQPLKEA